MLPDVPIDLFIFFIKLTFDLKRQELVLILKLFCESEISKLKMKTPFFLSCLADFMLPNFYIWFLIGRFISGFNVINSVVCGICKDFFLT